MRVAIIGARGIGKHHAKWFHHEGCTVVAFAGANPERLGRTRTELCALFPFEGRSYAGAEAMLAAEQPELVVIASPHALHLEHLRLAVRAGAHVYLEKPFVWPRDAAPDLELMAAAAAVLDEADRAGRLVGFNTQYACGWAPYRQLAGAEADLARARKLFVAMESWNRGRHRDLEEVWIDLAPHPLSMLMALRPQGGLVTESLRVEFAGNHCRARFRWDDSGQPLEVELQVGSLDQGQPQRTFGVDDVLVSWGGRNEADGVFRSVLTRGARELVTRDFMHEAIARFLCAVRTGDTGGLAADGRDGLRNLALHTELFLRAVRS